MVQVVLGKLKDRGKDIAALLESKIGVSPVVEGDKITFEGGEKPVRVRDVKTYLKRFLHREGLKRDFRLLVQGGVVNVVELERVEEEEEE